MQNGTATVRSAHISAHFFSVFCASIHKYFKPSHQSTVNTEPVHPAAAERQTDSCQSHCASNRTSFLKQCVCLNIWTDWTLNTKGQILKNLYAALHSDDDRQAPIRTIKASQKQSICLVHYIKLDLSWITTLLSSVELLIDELMSFTQLLNWTDSTLKWIDQNNYTIFIFDEVCIIDSVILLFIAVKLLWNDLYK